MFWCIIFTFQLHVQLVYVWKKVYVVYNYFSLTKEIKRYFLDQGYAVIFVYRQKSALPFQRYFTNHNPLEFLNVLDSENDSSARDIVTGKIL